MFKRQEAYEEMTKQLISEVYESNQESGFITDHIYNCSGYNRKRIGFLISDNKSFEIQLTAQGYTLEVMNSKSFPPKYRIWYDRDAIHKSVRRRKE